MLLDFIVLSARESLALFDGGIGKEGVEKASWLEWKETRS
jgi:hypothetical protein